MFKKLIKLIKSFLYFCGLMDDSGQLSRTNLFMYAFIFKFISTPMNAASTNDVIMALAASGLYMGKKLVTKKSGGEDITEEIVTSPSVESLTDTRVIE
jgi:hypothetical protein